jgi:hypothetical protein
VAYGFGTNDSSDAELDFDRDGQSNTQEYLAGTDPRDPESFLKIESMVLEEGRSAVLQFQAVAGKTYALQSRNVTGTGAWVRLAEVVAFATNRLVSITNSVNGATGRFYRLVTPNTP